MPAFKKSRIRFRQLDRSDATYISKWLAGTLYKSPVWEHQFWKTLLNEWALTPRLSRECCWMAMYGDQRLFFLEITTGDEVFLIAPRGLLDNRIVALAAWRRVVVHLRNLGTLPGLRVILDKSREVECDCLLQLGFVELIARDEFPSGIQLSTLGETANNAPNQRIFHLNWLFTPAIQSPPTAALVFI